MHAFLYRSIATEEAPRLNVLFYHDKHADLIVPENDLCSMEFPEDTTDVSYPSSSHQSQNGITLPERVNNNDNKNNKKIILR